MNTHVHADHITGSGKLKGLVPGSKSMLSGDSGAKADIYLDQGEKINIGEIELEARKTPGHTNGKCCYSKGLTSTITACTVVASSKLGHFLNLVALLVNAGQK